MKVSTESAVIITGLVAVISAALTSVIWLLAAQHPEVLETVATHGNITADRTKFDSDNTSKINETGEWTARNKTVVPQEKVTADKTKDHQDLVSKVNQIGQWTARYNTVGPREPRCGESGDKNFTRATQARADDGMRSHFDARNKWPHCVLLQQPAMNQGSCGSCWAVAATSAIADRICIATDGRKQPRLSVLDVLCNYAMLAKVDPRELCAAGGYPYAVYAIWKRTGIVTGGIYGSADGCKPYPFSGSCGSPCPWSSEPMFFECNAECQPLYAKGYDDDKYYGMNPTALELDPEAPNPIPSIQRAIIETGPVTGGIYVFEDFLHYGSGVYRYTEGKYCYGHLVKIIGWGRENGVDYWIIANSWGETWGETSGCDAMISGLVNLIRTAKHLMLTPCSLEFSGATFS